MQKKKTFASKEEVLLEMHPFTHVTAAEYERAVKIFVKTQKVWLEKLDLRFFVVFFFLNLVC